MAPPLAGAVKGFSNVGFRKDDRPRNVERAILFSSGLCMAKPPIICVMIGGFKKSGGAGQN